MSAADDDDDRGERKASVIHTRVPEDLDAEIKKRANNLGMSVSNLVRNVLTHAFGLVGDIVADSASVARSAKGAPLGAATTTTRVPGPIVGWQEAVLNLNAVCARCNAILKKGTSAAVAVPTGSAVICRACLKEIQNADDE